MNKRKLTSSKIIALGYIAVILIGTLILCLPISSKERVWTSFINSLFTATTSTCVTGLIVFDTFTHWSIFGQIVILLLIQVGGIGFMTLISVTGLFIKRKINISERKILMQSSGSIHLSEVLTLAKKILIGTGIFELIGVILLSIRFIPDMGFWTGLYYAIFHSISAFCNAGIDLMGRFGECSSLTTYANDYLVNFTIMFLIIMGGLGFLVWSDVFSSRGNFKRLKLHSKIVLLTTISLIIIPAFLFYFFESDNAMAGFSNQERILASLFQSVTTRTAGFNTIDLAKLSDPGTLLTLILMLIGGSPGSTAGGIKTTTFVVLLLVIPHTFKTTTSITVGKKQLEKSVIKQAAAILILYMVAIFIAALIILAIEPFSLDQVLFECFSAIGTVGLTKGITSQLTIISKIIIIILMYIGRIGALAAILFFKEKEGEDLLQRPVEKILIG